jgi:translocation and assembly module TamB
MVLRRAAWAALFSLLILIALVFAAGAWLLYSPSGLQWLAARGTDFTADALRIEGVAGTLARGASAQRIRYATDDLSVQVHDARFALSIASLFKLAPHVEQLHAERVEIQTKPSDEPRAPLPDSLALPVTVTVEDARIGTLVFDNGENAFDLENVRLRRYAGGARGRGNIERGDKT